MKGKRVVAAMSGGVDSSVTAALLKEAGYEVIGISMQLWCEEKHHLSPTHPTCCSLADIDDARKVCSLLGIPFYVLNLEAEFETYVVKPFCEGYAQGKTPNPCVDCNQHVKFGFLWQKALSLGADYLATGHYARIEYCQGKYLLLKGVDPRRDQSYFLYMLEQKDLEHVLFPLGDLLKAEVRRMADQRKLPVSDKRESRDLCFMPDGDYRAFLSPRILPLPGDIFDTSGKKLGEHRGISCYTVGQRWGLGLVSQKRLYVVKIIPRDNIIIVGLEAELYGQRLLAAQVHFVSGEKPSQPIALSAKVRYKSPEAAAVFYPQEGDRGEVRFEEPQRALTPGQAVVFYRGEAVAGGGGIERDDAQMSVAEVAESLGVGKERSSAVAQLRL